jgi:hypothetical protein
VGFGVNHELLEAEATAIPTHLPDRNEPAERFQRSTGFDRVAMVDPFWHPAIFAFLTRC